MVSITCTVGKVQSARSQMMAAQSRLAPRELRGHKLCRHGEPFIHMPGS